VPADDVTYDADKSVITVKLYSRASYESVPEKVDISSTVIDSTKALGRYRGVTRMGIKFNYDATLHYSRTVRISVPFASSLTKELEVPVPPAQARQFKNDLYLLSLGAIAYPYRESTHDEDTASLDDPVDQTNVSDEFTTEAKCLYLVRGSTGEVLNTYVEAGAGGSASAVPSVAPGPKTVEWSHFPDAQDIAALFPTRAQEDEVEGAATVTCEVADAGGHVNCASSSETPMGYGFGAAAVHVFERSAIADTKGDSSAIGTTLKATIRFSAH